MADQRQLAAALLNGPNKNVLSVLAELLDQSVAQSLPMEGRATFLPVRVTSKGKELAVPGLLAGAWNAFTAPGRAYRGQLDDPTEEAINLASMLQLGALPAPAAGGPGTLGMNSWRPTSRGVFTREGLTDMQCTVPSDARLVPPVGPKMSPSPLVSAITSSPTVRSGLRADIERGLPMGGESWYNLAPIARFAEEHAEPGMMSFKDYNLVGAGASMQNSVPNEMSAASIINFARKRGLTLDEAKNQFKKETGSQLLPMITGGHEKFGRQSVERGVGIPATLTGGEWKVPMYGDKRIGGGGVLDINAPGSLPALDTHEKRRIMQLARQDPELSTLMREMNVLDADHVPVKNAADYRQLGSMYIDAAKEMGLPTAGTAQAGRWIGGWKETGLKSPPFGDYAQITEDMLAYSAQQRGMPTDPVSLRKYFARVLRGDDFILPYTGKGAIPLK